MQDEPTRQIIYQSTACGIVDTDLILEQSRHNNAIDGVTGVLWTDGRTFVQVLEGPSLSVTEAFTRIGRDPRHQGVTILSDRHLAKREFGSWSMAKGLLTDAEDDASLRLHRRLAALPVDVRERFLAATR